MRYVALWLCGIAVVTYILQQFFTQEPFVLVNSLKLAQPWRILTAVFAHANLLHLLNNIIALSLFGLILEGRIGPPRVLALFMTSGLLINLLMPYERSLGASGAIYAILGALIILRPLMIIYINFLPLPMAVAGLLFLAQDILGIFYPSGVGNLAHITGLFFGIAAGLFWMSRFGDKTSKEAERPRNLHLERELDEWERTHMRKD